MPVLTARIEDQTKARFRALAAARGVTESELLRRLVLAAADQVATPEVIKPAAIDYLITDRLTVRLPRFLMALTRQTAKSKGMAPSRWIAALVQSNLAREPVMTDDEVRALLNSARQLAALGRNLNQIAKALNDFGNETDRVRIDLLEELLVKVTQNRALIRALVRASQNAWQVE